MSLEDKIETLTEAIKELNNNVHNLVGFLLPAGYEQKTITEVPKTELKKVEGFKSKQVVTQPIEEKQSVEMKPVFEDSVVSEETVKQEQPTSNAPFTTMEGLTEYTTKIYHANKEKGPLIQKIINDLGYSVITDIKPEQFGLFYEKVQAL